MAELVVPALVTSIVGGVVSSATAPKAPKAPPPPPTLTWEQARKQAGDVLNPIYDQQSKNTLQNVDRQSIARGFYGQMPADAFRGARAADVEVARAGQIGSLAQQMQGQNYQQALQSQQLAMQQALAQQQMGLGAFGQGIQSALQYHDLTGDWMMGIKPGLTTKQKTGLAMQTAQNLPGYNAPTTNPYKLDSSLAWFNPFR